MIEKYFVPGARFKWTIPAPVYQAMDGSIVDSQTASPQMTYDGLDDQFLAGSMYGGLPNVSAFGLRKGMQIQYQWLDYNLGRTARQPMGPYDVITGPMSGCLITRWTDKGINYAGHVGTVDDRPAENKTVKSTYARDLAANATGFNPAAAITFGDASVLQRRFRVAPSAKVCALVTTSGNFYALLFLGLQFDASDPSIVPGQDWVLGAIKQVPPLNRIRLQAALMA